MKYEGYKSKKKLLCDNSEELQRFGGGSSRSSNSQHDFACGSGWTPGGLYSSRGALGDHYRALR